MKEEDPNWLMGFQLIDDRDNQTTLISHEQYISSVLKRFSMLEAAPVSTPMEAGLSLSVEDGPLSHKDKEAMSVYPYHELVGSLTWISMISRPDILFAASYLGRYFVNPGMKHWKAALHVLHYLSGTHRYCLALGDDPTNDKALDLTGWSDADWAMDVDMCRSVSGYIFRLGSRTVTASSKRQSNVAKLSTEAEYTAASYAASEGMWIRYLLEDLGVDFTNVPTPLHIDNTATISIMKDPHFHSKMRHVSVSQNFIRKQVEEGTFITTYVPTKQMIADRLTKPLAREAFKQMVTAMGLTSS